MIAVTVHCPLVLPDCAYDLWLRDELAGKLRPLYDDPRVEIIDGNIVVSPSPDLVHNNIAVDIERTFLSAEAADPSFPWRCIKAADLNLADIRDGYIPDLIVLEGETDSAASKAQVPRVLPDQAGLVVEITCLANAAYDRPPTMRRLTATKFTGYARVGIPYYLLIDRDPRSGQAILYSSPDRASGSYMHLRTFDFGEPMRIPKPFDLVIDTGEWAPWS